MNTISIILIIAISIIIITGIITFGIIACLEIKRLMKEDLKYRRECARIEYQRNYERNKKIYQDYIKRKKEQNNEKH